MASIGIHPRQNHHLQLSFIRTTKSDHVSSSVAIPRRPRRILPQRVSASNSSTMSVPDSDGVFVKMSDSWMLDSMAEIVRNLPKAPLLVQIHSEDGGRRRRVQVESAVEEEWEGVRSRWMSGESKSPDGVIFVDELKVDDGGGGGDDDVTSGWGVVVQGKGGDVAPSCYLLKTDKACGGRGMDFCTHFCLMRMNGFRGSSTMENFRDSWLLQTCSDVAMVQYIV